MPAESVPRVHALCLGAMPVAAPSTRLLIGAAFLSGELRHRALIVSAACITSRSLADHVTSNVPCEAGATAPHLASQAPPRCKTIYLVTVTQTGLLSVAARLSYKAAAWKLSELAALEASSSAEKLPLSELTTGGGLLSPVPAEMPHDAAGSAIRAGLSGSRRLAPKATGAAWRDSASSSAAKPPSIRMQPPSGEYAAGMGDPLAIVEGVHASAMDTVDGVPRAAERPPAVRPEEPGRDQARPSALASRLGVHGVVATLMGDATDDAAHPPSSLVAGDNRSGSSPVADGMEAESVIDTPAVSGAVRTQSVRRFGVQHAALCCVLERARLPR